MPTKTERGLRIEFEFNLVFRNVEDLGEIGCPDDSRNQADKQRHDSDLSRCSHIRLAANSYCRNCPRDTDH